MWKKGIIEKNNMGIKWDRCQGLGSNVNGDYETDNVPGAMPYKRNIDWKNNRRTNKEKGEILCIVLLHFKHRHTRDYIIRT